MDDNIDISEREEDIKSNIDDNSISCNNNLEVEQECIYRDLKRYSRYDLLSLRNDQLSIHHPECALRPDLQALSIWTCRLRCELQYLGLWKVPNTGNQYGNCGSNAACCQPPYVCADGQSTYSSPGCNNVGGGVGGISGGCYTNAQQTHVIPGSSPTLGNKRAVRSRERFLNHQRCINTELTGATSPGEVSLHNSNHQTMKAAFIDHRSISSSHLMPAFAKRRMGSVNPLHNNTNACGDHLGNEGGSDDGDSPKHARKDTIKAGNSYNDHFAYKTSGHNNRMDNNDGQLMDNQPGWMNLVKKINSDYSPSNNKTNSGGGGAGVNKKLNYERRIGSGRLVQRDANWDMRTGANAKQVEKNTGEEKDNIDGGNGVDKLNQRYASNRYSDPRSQERRLYDRRISVCDDNKEKHESNTTSGTTFKRHLTNHGGDDRNNMDANINQPYQQAQQNFVGQRSMSFRRREYTDHRDHRDYRDFREQRDLRDHRELREPKDHHHHHRDNRNEPEWFSEGPTSQHDTIELRGFEEIDDTDLDDVKHSSKLERKSSESSLSHNSSNFNLSTNENSAIVSNDMTKSSNVNLLTSDNDNISCKVNNQPNKEVATTDDNIDVNETSINILKADEKSTENIEKCGSNVTEIFFDNFLNMEALESTLIGGQDQTMATNESGGTSRFSRWFFNNSNNNNNINVNDKEEFIKDEAQKPIKNFTENNHSEPNTFMAFLKCNNFPTPELPKSLPVNVSAMSVEELEARMRKMDTSDKTKCDIGSGDGLSKSSEIADFDSQVPDAPSQDVEAFRKLLDQLGKPQVDISMNIILPQTGHPTPITTPVSVLPTGIISHSLPQANMLKQEHMLKMMHQQQHHQQLIHHQQQQNLIKVVPSQHHLHHQMAQLSPQQQVGVGGSENMPLMSLPPPHHPQLMSMVIGHPQKRILDVQHLMQSVVREELSRSFLERELRNPNIPPYAKDIICTVLKETSRLITPSSAGNQNSLSTGAAAIIDTNTTQHPAAAENVASQNLMQSLARGEVSLNLLEHELNKLNTPTIINEPASSAVFKEKSRCVTPSAVPISAMLVTPTTQVNSPQNSTTTGENIGTMSLSEHQQHALSLLRSQHEDPSQHIPTQRELQIHTQAIMQNALLKKKLEVEQHEAIRRRQEMHKQLELKTPNQHHQPQHNSVLPQPQQQVQQPPTRHMNSPTPLAFTPTSVLRKMTAEKDNNFQQATTLASPQHQQSLQPHLKLMPQQILNQQLSYQHVNQPRMILGGGNHQHLHHQQQQHQVTTSTNGSPQISPQQKAQIRNQPPAPIKWPSVPHQHSSMNSAHPLISNITKPMGRPILKGPIPTVIQQHTQNQHQQQNSNQSNQIQSSQPTQTHMSQIQKSPTQQQPRQIVGHQFPTHLLQHQNNIQHQQMFQQQQQRSTPMHRQQLQHTDSVGNHAPVPAPVHHPSNTDNNSVTNLSYQRDGGLSPTSNQLAQWFSPELLAQASAGKLPLLNMNQALSLEEFERSIQHSSTAVHN